MTWTRMLSVIATLLVLSCAACTQVTDPQTATPPASESASTPSPPSSSTTPSVSPYLGKYTARQRKAYVDASRDYWIYRTKEARFERQATAPVAARRFYRAYTADWLTFWAVRQQWADSGIRVLGKPKVLWSRPALVRLADEGGGSIRIRMCLDARHVKVTQRGKSVPQNSTATMSTISMTRLPDDVRWKFLLAKAGKPC